MKSLEKSYLLLLVIITSVSVNAQEMHVINMIEAGHRWDSTISEMAASNFEISERFITSAELQKSIKRIQKDLRLALSDFESDKSNPDYYEKLLWLNTNSSLWYSQVTSNDFQIFLRRLVTGRPISREVPQNLKKAYSKWLKVPSLKNLDRYSQLLHDTGRSYEILTNLNVDTNGLENIVVKYRSITEDNVETMEISSAMKMIPVGNYRVWMEREGSILSDYTSGFPCITGKKEIVLASW